MSFRNLLLLVLAGFAIPLIAEERPPNIVYIMSDELAYFELGHMGNPYIKTPRIDRFASEGVRFTHAHAASPVCAPLRGCLLTGRHAGHASVRANDGGTPLRADEVTIGEMLKEKGYATGGFGKWGAGGRDSTGVPEKHGFDVFFGYYDQVHAHSFFPPYLVRNSEEVVLPGNEGGRTGETYSHYEIMEAGLQFIRDNRDRPFFCYLPITPPHGMYDIPADDPAWEQYAGEEWIEDPSLSQDAKNYAAMVTMIDNDLGDVVDLLAELGLEGNTIVFFTGDNGGQDRFKSKAHPRGFFGPNVDPKTGVEFRGGKGNLYQGGVRIPFLVRWPGRIEGGRVSDLLFAQYDIMATLAELTGAEAPENDGISILPTILGSTEVQETHEMLYWEFGKQTAVRFGRWKAIRPNEGKPWELYDLEADPSETTSIAGAHPEVLEKMKSFADASHTPARPGTYSDPSRERHERDRWAKWGSSRPQQQKKPAKVHRLREDGLIDPGEMTVVAFSSENHANDRKAEYAVDGRPTTLWHSRFTGTVAEPPHELVIDLGKERTIAGFRYLGRQDSGYNGAFAETTFHVADSTGAFDGDPVASATFTKDKAPQVVDLEKPVTGRYLKITVLSEVNGKSFASAAEIGVVEAGE